MSIIIFKTNIRYKYQLPSIANSLSNLPGILKWNIDWHDKDRILRVVTNNLSPQLVEQTLRQAGYYCEELE